MTQPIDPSEKPPRKVSVMGIVMLGLVAVMILLLLLPSAKQQRVTTAKKYLAENFPIVSKESIEPLLGSHLLTDNQFVYDARSKECAIFIFRPDTSSYYSADTMVREVTSPNRSYGAYDAQWSKLPIVTLLAPDETSNGWTLFAKIWLAKALKKEKVADLKQLGLELSTNSSVLGRLKKIWAKVPAKTKARATQVLEENREVAKLYRKSPRFYSGKAIYKIDERWELSDFIWDYIAANPELYPHWND